MRERECVGVREKERVCVCEKESERERECVGVRKRERVCVGVRKRVRKSLLPRPWCLWARCNQRHYTSYNYISSAVVPLLYRCILVTVKELCVRY